jgi:hypothetical protein
MQPVVKWGSANNTPASCTHAAPLEKQTVPCVHRRGILPAPGRHRNPTVGPVRHAEPPENLHHERSMVNLTQLAGLRGVGLHQSESGPFIL